jgi:uncharacterized protein (DUF608 family)
MTAQTHQATPLREGACLNKVAFPLGGIGAGMICLDGTGGFSHVSLRNRPNLAHSPYMFSALTLLSPEKNRTVLIEGALPPGKRIAQLPATAGLPRLKSNTFTQAFPLAVLDFQDDSLSLEISLTGWSPFIPLDADNSSLPVAALEYQFANTSSSTLDCVYSFNAKNFMQVDNAGYRSRVRRMEGGFLLCQDALPEQPWTEAYFAAFVDDDNVMIDPAWYRGGHRFNPPTMLWNRLRTGAFEDREEWQDDHGPSVGGSLFLPFSLRGGEEKTIRLLIAWYVPESDVREGTGVEDDANNAEVVQYYKPWYSGRFESMDALSKYWRDNCDTLRTKTFHFSDCLAENTLPPTLMEAVGANLSILKSPTVLRQTDGRLWLWEGSSTTHGSCYGSCTHVWNYAQACCHLFPELERSLRHTEFNESQDDSGHQEYRTPLPIRPTTHTKLAPADGQLGGVMKAFRDWRISGDTDWLCSLWPKITTSLDYCIATWDPDHRGYLAEPHHNTYDIEFWGPNGMCCSFYLGALKAAVMMGHTLGASVSLYDTLYSTGRHFMETALFNGEYFIQHVSWKNLRSPDPARAPTLQHTTGYDTPEAMALLATEGPMYQYGNGCLADGVLGAWIAAMCGIGEILDSAKVRSHLLSVYQYNYRKDLSRHINPQRPQYALGDEAGLLLCTWPHDDRPSLPFIYSDEVWTGIEYQVASHLALLGETEKAEEIITGCRARYDGRIRNPFDEEECGHWYGRALSSYGLLQGFTGIRYDAIDKTLHIHPAIQGDFRSFLCTHTGYGHAGVRGGQPFVDVFDGTIEVKQIDYNPFDDTRT